MPAKLSVIKVKKGFGGIQAVNECTFDVESESITALIGPNGAGKTTVFNLISGFLAPDEGKIVLEGEDITSLKVYQRAQKGIARTFQLVRLFPKMSVMENMLLSMKHTKETLIDVLVRRTMAQQQEEFNTKRALELLELVHLHTKTGEYAGHLSYGQQKLLEIAKALAAEPEIILLDEPTAGVNPTMVKKIGNLLLKLKQQGKTILFIEHDMEFVMNIADKIIVLDYGKEIAVGTPKEIQKNKRVIDAYLGITQ